MTYADFTTLESALAAFGLTASARPLFPGLHPVAPPGWLTAQFAHHGPFARRNEKGRSEFLIAPILLAAKSLSGDGFGLYTGQPLNVDPARGLAGECDFILGDDPAAVVLQSPLLTVVEAKKADIDLGTGQALAQMVAAREYNERAGRPTPVACGCVSTGAEWQFMRLDGTALAYEPQPYPVADLGRVLAAILAAVAQARGQTP